MNKNMTKNQKFSEEPSAPSFTKMMSVSVGVALIVAIVAAAVTTTMMTGPNYSDLPVAAKTITAQGVLNMMAKCDTMGLDLNMYSDCNSACKSRGGNGINTLIFMFYKYPEWADKQFTLFYDWVPASEVIESDIFEEIRTNVLGSTAIVTESELGCKCCFTEDAKPRPITQTFSAKLS